MGMSQAWAILCMGMGGSVRVGEGGSVWVRVGVYG